MSCFCTLVTTTPHDYATETLLIFAVSISPLSYQFSSPVPASLFGKLPRQTPTLPVNSLQFSSVSLQFALSFLLCCYQSVMTLLSAPRITHSTCFWLSCWRQHCCYRLLQSDFQRCCSRLLQCVFLVHADHTVLNGILQSQDAELALRLVTNISACIVVVVLFALFHRLHVLEHINPQLHHDRRHPSAWPCGTHSASLLVLCLQHSEIPQSCGSPCSNMSSEQQLYDNTL